jgi:predicted RND superfamily exporter protein
MRTYVRRVADWVPLAIIAIDLALMAVLGAYLYRGGAIVNNAIDIWFDRSDPTVDVLAQERQLFGSDTWMLATVWMRPERIAAAGDVARALTDDLERLQGVTRVISPVSLDVLQRDEQGLFYAALDRDAWPVVRERLLTHPFASELLVYTKSPEIFSLLIKEHTGPTTPGVVRQHLVTEVRRILDAHPAVAASAVAGTAVINADLNRMSWRDFLILVPLTVVVACIVLLIMLRFRWRTTLAILTPVALTSGALISAMLLSGRPFTMVTIALPGLTFTLGVASCLHVTGWIVNYLQEGRGTPEEATRTTWRELIRPILVAQITTALGFGLLAVIPVTPVQEMALFGAAGELLSGLHVIFVLPKALYWFGSLQELSDKRALYAGSQLTANALGALGAWLTRLQRIRGPLAIAMIAIVILMGWLTSRVRYDSTYIHMIQSTERLRVDYARFDAVALLSAKFCVVIRNSREPGVVDAGVIAAIVNASAEIEALPDVSKVVGPASIYAEVAPALAGDEPMSRFGADNASVTDAYIFALSGGNTEIPSYVHDGLGAYRLIVFFPYLDNSKLELLSRREIPSIMQKHLGGLSEVSSHVSGITVLWANMDDAMSRGQIASVIVMAVACFITFYLSLRNWTLSACAMFVNLLPVAVISSVLGATGRPIDMATVFIMGISLGIAVDDTSFFIHDYLDRRQRGEGGLIDALRHTGPSTIATCIVIVIGFSVLLTSSFIPMRTFGGLTAVGLILAMLSDLLILSFLLLAFSGRANRLHYAQNTVASSDVVPVHGRDTGHA